MCKIVGYAWPNMSSLTAAAAVLHSAGAWGSATAHLCSACTGQRPRSSCNSAGAGGQELPRRLMSLSLPASPAPASSTRQAGGVRRSMAGRADRTTSGSCACGSFFPHPPPPCGGAPLRLSSPANSYYNAEPTPPPTAAAAPAAPSASHSLTASTPQSHAAAAPARTKARPAGPVQPCRNLCSCAAPLRLQPHS